MGSVWKGASSDGGINAGLQNGRSEALLEKWGAGHCVWQKKIAIEQLETKGSQDGVDARRIKNENTEENQAGT